ncbi:hypothetical protein [Mannheimia varigena]|uniref:hypothetical protein n=1 Tax=Mannheimia varigena TaxID=85404 RepID=UPI0015B41135|nr:hypothetical protein [Mannheimia varigena]QLD33617.1 hypothetical protein A6B42_07470 [Mannheimia varigena]
MQKTFLATVLCAFVLTGCAVKKDNTELSGLGLTYSSDVTQNAEGNYVAAVEASLISGRKGGAEAYVLKNATDFCANQNKLVRVLKNETESHLLVNGVAKLTFQCK